MAAGIFLIIPGILRVVFPQLLSLMAALPLLIAGAIVVSIAWHERRLQRHLRNPTLEVFFRH